jgi:hypothetical protein
VSKLDHTMVGRWPLAAAALWAALTFAPAGPAPASADTVLAQILAQAPTQVPRAQTRTAPGPIAQAKTRLVEFEASPFPFDGVNPRTGKPFLDVDDKGERVRRAGRGRVLSEDETFSDPRVLLHIPQGFDVRKPGVVVIFFHGHRATIGRDVLARQKVAEQVSKSRANAVLVAPQFAVNAADSSAGIFWEPGLFELFLDEVSEQLAFLNGVTGTTRLFDRMAVVIVAYSGGFGPAAWAIHHGDRNKRLRGVVLLDALYGELDKFEHWITGDRNRFFVSGYLGSTRAKNLELQKTLREKNIALRTSLDGQLRPGSVTFIAGGPDENHTDYVTRAWADNPITDLLNRMPEYRR